MSGIRSIVVVGNGLGAALAAAVLAGRLGAAYRVTIVPGGDDPHGLGPVGTAISTRPGFARFMLAQGLAPDGVMAAADGAFTLGAAFSGWRGDAHGWMLPYGDIGAPIGPVAFHQLLHRWRAEGAQASLADHAIAAVAAQADRFAPPGDDPASPLWSIDHGLSFDIDLLATLFLQRAVARGVSVADRPLQAFDRDTGALRLADGSIVAGDFFVDLTGTQALLSSDHG